MGKKKLMPTVSICTPTFNRRPFIPMLFECIKHQDYPHNKIEWIIVDDGTDSVQDLFSVALPNVNVKYYRVEEKMTLGKKRNYMNSLATGEIIVYMDDDDYYPPDRVSHAVDTLMRNKMALCAGSSAMYIYFKELATMYQFGPYGEKHATAATFAFRRKLLDITSFGEDASVAEEPTFLKGYTIPFVQLDPAKTILVFAHPHNSCDKSELLKNKVQSKIVEVDITPSQIIKNSAITKFFLHDIDDLLANYTQGSIEHKPDVMQSVEKLKEKIKQRQEDSVSIAYAVDKINLMKNPDAFLFQYNEKGKMVAELMAENTALREKNAYLENKITEIIRSKIHKNNVMVIDDELG